MKKLLLMLVAALPSAAQATTTVDLQGTVFAVDTLRHYYIADGVTQSVLRFHTDDRAFHVSVTDMHRPTAHNARAQVIIGRDSCNTAETVSSMAARHTTDKSQVIAGINGDFFITSSFASQHEFGNGILGYPNTTCIIDSRLAAPDIIDKASRENSLIFAGDDWYIDATDLKYRVLNNDGSTIVDASAVNYPRRDGEMVVYNSFAGKYTPLTANGRELVLRREQSSAWAINKSVKFTVDGTWRQGGCTAIPEDGIVISCGPSYSNAFIDGLAQGDVVKLKIVCSLPAFGVKPAITDAIGGDVRILKENVTTTEAIRWINTPSAKYSRTLAGYDRERTHLVMCCVDAGSAGNSGVTYYEAADLMRYLGCWDALDLDGGGSTEMWSASHGIVNTLRDGSERAVGNGLFITLDAPADKTVASIRFADPRMALPKYGIYKPVVYGYNIHGQLVDTDVKGFTLEAGSELGQVRDEGTSLLADGSGTHVLTARKDGMEAQLTVRIDDSQKAVAALDNIIVDQYHRWSIELQAPVGEKMMAVDPRAYEWESSDESTVTVDASGCVSGVSDGSATVTGKSAAGSVSVNVISQCPPASKAPLESTAFDATGWKLTGASTSGRSISALGEDADNGEWAVDFKVSGTRNPQVTVSHKIQIWGIPDAIELTVNTGESKIARVTMSTSAASSPNSPVKSDFEAPVPGVDNVLSVSADRLCDTQAASSYPLTFNSLRFDCLSTGQHRIEVKGIRAVYNSFENGVENVSPDRETTHLSVLVCDGRVSIPFVAEELTACDLTGRVVARASDSQTLPELPSGMYIITAIDKGRRLSAKLRL